MVYKDFKINKHTYDTKDSREERKKLKNNNLLNIKRPTKEAKNILKRKINKYNLIQEDQNSIKDIVPTYRAIPPFNYSKIENYQTRLSKQLFRGNFIFIKSIKNSEVPFYKQNYYSKDY